MKTKLLSLAMMMFTLTAACSSADPTNEEPTGTTQQAQSKSRDPGPGWGCFEYESGDGQCWCSDEASCAAMEAECRRRGPVIRRTAVGCQYSDGYGVINGKQY